MYEFRDTFINKNFDEECLPTSAMSYDGMFLERYIDGYRTLSVEGREMYSLSLETQEKQIGSFITNVKYPSRALTVKYKLEDRNPEVLQAKFDALLAFLVRRNDVSIRFNDDLAYSFKGRFSGADSVDGSSNSIISTYTIYCADPFKHGEELTSNGLIVTQLPYDVKPDKFIITPKSTILNVTDGMYHFKISQGIKSVDTIIADFSTGLVTVNGVDKSNILDLDSDFKNIRLHTQSDFRQSGYDIKIAYRKAVL